MKAAQPVLGPPTRMAADAIAIIDRRLPAMVLFFVPLAQTLDVDVNVSDICIPFKYAFSKC